MKANKMTPLPKDVQETLQNAEFILLNILDHISSGRMDKELTKDRLISVCKSLPIAHHDRLLKYC